LDKARNGAVVVLKDLMQISNNTLIILITSSIIVAGAATLITLGLARIAIRFIDMIDYTKIAWSIIIFLTLLTTFLSGPIGLFIMILATALGILTQLVGIRKSAAMGCLVIPVIIFFLG